MDSATLEFAVVDVETTGLFAQAHDRVIEVGVAVTDGRGQQLDRFETLVNPGRDLGPTEIHGIRGRDVEDAPTFAEIVGDLCERLGNRVLAAHNARFDRGFLSAEFTRCGFSFPDAPWLCTMELGGSMTGHGRLSSCCEQLGVGLDHPHCAADDAAAAAAILCCWLGLPESRSRLSSLLETMPIPAVNAWPPSPPSGRTCLRSNGRPLREPSFLSSLIAQLPPGRHASADAAAAYFELLDRALEDRHLTSTEAGALQELAGAWGLGAEDVELIHRDYLRSLAVLAWRDGKLTEAERADLEDAAFALGLNADVLAGMVEAPVAAGRAAAPAASGPEDQWAGRSICFTGQLTCTIKGAPITRPQAQQLAADRGLVVHSSVSKALDLLVVADPDSLSGKARKAREYGTRVVVERAFWREIGVAVD